MATFVLPLETVYAADYSYIKVKLSSMGSVTSISFKVNGSYYIKENPYYNALQVKFAYALTCHKAQGGQWKAVFVDHGFLNEEMLDKEYYRWLYTAFTRPTEKLFLVNFNKP